MVRSKMAVTTGWLIEVDKMDVPTVVGALFFLLVLAIESRVSRMLGKYFITELYL